MQGTFYHSGRALSLLDLCSGHAARLKELLDMGNCEPVTALDVKCRLNAFLYDCKAIENAVKQAYKEGEFSGGW